jgi:hypothetical protein
MIVALSDRRGRASLDVLWISNTCASGQATVRCMLASLARWAARQGCSTVRYYPRTVELSNVLRALGPVVSRPIFAYWTADAALMTRLGRAEWRWQLIDGDFEWV